MPKTKTPAEQRAELQRELEENDKKIEALERKQEQLDHQMTRAKNTLSYMNAKERKARTHRLIQKGGMICDYAIHNPHRDGDVPNPHVHVLCPIRPLNENGEWGNKRRREYELDEDGNRLRDENGDYEND